MGTLNQYLKKWPILQDEFDEQKQAAIDTVHQSILKTIEEGGQGAHLLMMFYMKTQAGWRETQNVVTQNHNFDWTQRLKEVKNENPDVVEGVFSDGDNDTGW